jgi:hypothetical protein
MVHTDQLTTPLVVHSRSVLPQQMLYTWSYSPRRGVPAPTPTTTYVCCEADDDSARAEDYRKSPHAVFPFKTVVDTPSRGRQKMPINFKGQLVPPPERSPGRSPPVSWRVLGTPLSEQRDEGADADADGGERVDEQQQLDWQPLRPPGGRSPRAPLALWP